MKRYIILLIFCVSLILLNGQNLSLSDEFGPVANNSYVNVSGTSTVSELIAEFNFTNNGSETIEVCVKKTEFYIVPGTVNTFAFGGLLFPPLTYQSPIQVSLNAGESSSEFAGYYNPYYSPGLSTIRYTFFDFYNPNDSVCVNVQFLAEDDDPLLTGVNPDESTIPGNLTVEISGSNTHFNMGSGTVVWFNQGSSTIYSTSVNEINNTLLLADFLFSNNHIPGVYDVHTNNNYDGQLVLPYAFTLNPNPTPPYLVSVTPSSAVAGEMVTVTITAANTNFTQGVDYAYLYQSYNYIFDHTITIVSDEVIIVEFPITTTALTGVFDLRVKSDWDGVMYLYDVFTVYPDPSPPYLTEIAPDNATIPETLSVTISGEGTHFTQATGTTVKLRQNYSNIYPSSVVEINDTELIAQFTFDDYDNPGYYNVITANALDGELYLYDAFYLNPNPYPPQLVSVEPDGAPQGDNLEVSISGQSTSFTQGTGTTVWFNMGSEYIYPYATSVINDELINASFLIDDDAVLGAYNVYTHNWANGTLVMEDGFTIYDDIPYISYIDPVSAHLGDLISLSIFGENTHFLYATNYDAWLIKESLVIYPLAINAISNNEIVAEIAIPEDADPGIWSVFATSSTDGDMYLYDAFEIIDTTTSVQNNELFNKLEIFPNPTTGKIFISYELKNSTFVTLQLNDFYGHTLYEETIHKNSVKNEELLVPQISSGVYYLRCSTGSDFILKKIIVK